MTVRGILILLLFGCGAAVAWGRPGVVTLQNGQTYSGEVDESDTDVVLVTAPNGIKTRIERPGIASIAYPAGFEEQFRARMGKLDAKDVNGRLALAREAFDAREYTLAREAAESARAADPNSADAAAMLDTIQSQIRLERNKQQPNRPPQNTARPAPDAPAPGAGDEAPSATQPGADRKLLGPAEINAIRQIELRPDDIGVRVRFDRDVKRRYITYSNTLPSDFNSMTVNQQVQKIITEGTPEMRRDVQILSDPPALFQYRRNVQPFIMANCATSGCHGGTNPAKFGLISPADSDPATYTNFYILQKYTKPTKQTGESVFGRGDLRVIDRQHPEQSLLLQYAMPGAIADSDHPDVPGYRAPLRGLNDPRHRLIAQWIGEVLQPVEPDYGFDAPALAATQPATDTSPGEPSPADPAPSGAAPTPPAPAAPVAPVPPAGAAPAR